MFDSKWVFNGKKNNNEDLISSVLSIRNILDKDSFLNPDLRNLYDPFLINDMDKAVKRIKIAITGNEKICIYGDYDADGITSSAILIRFFRDIDIDVDYFIPDRFDDGYGLNLNSLTTLINNGVQLVITTDCGINSTKEVDYLLENNVDIIITDHHRSSVDLPNASAVLCCTRLDNSYPYKNLSGAGIAFKLTEALKKSLCVNIDIRPLLALAAVGTVSDIVSLDGENRIIVSKGIEAIQEGICTGIEAILEVSSVDRKKTNSYTLGFVIGPRINAAGRMGDANAALLLMLTDDYDISRNTAIYLDKLNNLRKKEQDCIYEKILEKFIENPEIYMAPVIVTEGQDYNKGVIGIVASKISELYNKPAIILSDSNGILEGSGRSSGNFSLIQGLDYCSEILLKYGGHRNAAGLSLKSEDLVKFRKKICEYAINNEFFGSESNIIEVDTEIDSTDISYSMVEKLKLLEPFGNGNKEPVFALNNTELREIRKIGTKGQHLSFVFKSDEFTFKAVCFNASEYEPFLYTGEFYNILFNANINNYKDSSNIQLMLKDITFYDQNYKNFNYMIVRILAHMLKYEKSIQDAMKIEDLTGFLYKIGMSASADQFVNNKELYIVTRDDIAEVYKKLKALKKNDVFDIRELFDFSELTNTALSLEILVELGILKVIPLGMYKYRVTGIAKTDKKNLGESLIYRVFS